MQAGRVVRRVGAALLILLAGCAMLVAATTLPGDPALFPPAPGQPTIDVFVVDHGVHTGLVLSREAVLETATRAGEPVAGVATRFGAFNWLEFGWGDETFYRNVRTLSDFQLGMAARALLGFNDRSVVHVVGAMDDPLGVFTPSRTTRVPLSRAGFDRLVARLDASFARDPSGRPIPIGPGLYGPSLFYRGAGQYSLRNVCNHWTARLLAAAGVPTSPLLSTLPAGLVLDLRWRAGLLPGR